MKKKFSLLLLTLIITLSGCDNCSKVFYLQDSPFLFKLSNGNGNNLLDTKAIIVAQISIYNPSTRADSRSLSAFQQENQTWIQASLNRGQNE